MSHSSCHESSQSNKRWFQKPLYVTMLFTLLIFGASFLFPILEKFRFEFLHYMHLMIFPILLGLILGGAVDAFIPQSYIVKHLGGQRKRTILYAVGLGFLMSACSHGILALAVEFHKKGASGPAIISFLLASPWTSLPVTFLLLGFFGMKAFLIIGLALLVAIVTGYIFQVLDRCSWVEKNPNQIEMTEEFSIRKDLMRRFRERDWRFEKMMEDFKDVLRGIWNLTHMVFWWILLGAVFASLVAAYVPEHFFQQYLNSSVPGLLMTLAFATIIEVCSEGSSPLAFEIYRQTGAFGNVFAFLMAGVVTDFTEVGLIWMRFGKRNALWLIAVTLPQVLLLSWVLNAFF